jgi:hypothetical protein
MDAEARRRALLALAVLEGGSVGDQIHRAT